jgi:dTDP-glucose pyrophosphorylase
MAQPVLVLCMAGLYSRFRKAGYATPKFLLTMSGQTIIARIVSELAPAALVLIANERDAEHGDAIRAALATIGHGDADLHFVGDTSGQAETAAIGARRALALGHTGPLVFHNIDTVLLERDLGAIGDILTRSDGFIDVFDNDSAAYSYVAVDGDRVTDIAEKVVISRHATTGLYGFRSAAYYLEQAAETTRRSKGEFYISDVYRRMLDHGADIRIETESGPAIILGTPAEYESWTQENSP